MLLKAILYVLITFWFLLAVVSSSIYRTSQDYIISFAVSHIRTSAVDMIKKYKQLARISTFHGCPAIESNTQRLGSQNCKTAPQMLFYLFNHRSALSKVTNVKGWFFFINKCGLISFHNLICDFQNSDLLVASYVYDAETCQLQINGTMRHKYIFYTGCKNL